ncbi:MAG: hypothetical protein SVV03_02500 [Candidatus Nanohaloarchaea archaeon]|nr:hypothetical protein [Candidatus Nanohaloarchaea archaeon]
MTVDIYFSDLSEEKQETVLEELGVDNIEETNYDVMPLTSVAFGERP